MDKKGVQKLLRPDEICVVAGETKFVKNTGKKRVRSLAVVTHKPRMHESAIFAFKSGRFTQTVIKGIYPITQDFRCRQTSEHSFDLSLGEKDKFTFEGSTSAVKALISSIASAARSIQEASAAAPLAVETFEWTRRYVIDHDADTETGVADEDEPSEAPRAAAEAGAAEGEEVDYNPLMVDGLHAEYNPNVIKDIKEQWIERQMQEREAEFTERRPARIFVGTWNVNGKKPGEKLDMWLHTPEPADIYAIGFQELDLSAEAFLINNSTRAGPWEEAISESLAKLGRYELVLFKQLVGILLCVYVKSDHMPHVTDVQSDMAGVGIMGMMGNKGGVGIRFQFFDSQVCFVNSHLAARTSQIDRRNQDHKEICRRLSFIKRSENSVSDISIFTHDVLIWLGDLNYRVDLPDAEIKQCVATGDLNTLMQYDQLNVQRALKNTFVGFSEGRTDFIPTYKYDPGTNRFDTSEKKRSPAWCDRVLWIGKDVRQVAYGRQELMTSDHKPVVAEFDASIRVVMPEKRQMIQHEVMRELDQMENECMPDAGLSSSALVFGPARFLESVSQKLVVENTGQVVLKFSFIPKPGDTSGRYCPPWLTIRPHVGIAMPHEKIELTMTILVDNDTAPALNLGEKRLEDTLIMHLENGRDIFINVKGEWMRSCFGSSLEYLTCVVGPVRHAPAAADTLQAQLSVPKELWRIVDHLCAHAMDEADLFMEAGNEQQMARIREALDIGADLGALECSAHCMAETLLRFLDALAQPVMPLRMIPKCIENAGDAAQCHALVGVLPAAHYNVFVYVTAFLRELLQTRRGMAEKLATVFSAVLLPDRTRKPAASKMATDTARRKTMFLMHFLSEPDS